MRVIYHNWSATKQRPHPQSVAEISQFCQGTGFDNVRHRLGLTTRTQISVCKLPFPSAGTAVSLFRAKTEKDEPGELSQWLCHDDSTINIVVIIIIFIIIFFFYPW